MNDNTLLELLHDTATVVRGALDKVTDWGLAGTRQGQHLSDIAADEAALAHLRAANVGIMSEESGAHDADKDIVVVVDPLDGSTNALHGVPWFATSLCAVDGDGPRAAVVVNQASGTRFEAVRGGGARRDGIPIVPSATEHIAEAIVGLTGYPPRHLGWRQFRAMGAAALDIASVAAGVMDAYVDCTVGLHGPWDYLGGLLICQEAGAHVVDGRGEELITLDWTARRMPIAASTKALLDEVVAARLSADSDTPGKNG